MHGRHDPSLGSKRTLTALHLGIVVWAGWLLLGGGAATVLGWFRTSAPPADVTRTNLLIACAGIYWLRVTFGSFALMRRRMDPSEVAIVASWLFVIHTTFALLGGTNGTAPGLWAVVGLLAYLKGSVLNTGSELQRHHWKQDPSHAGHLYTGGLFRHSRHMNYFGDVMLFTGYALITGRVAALAIPVVMSLGFVFYQVPELDRHLASHYGDEYEQWASRTARLIPWVY